MRLLCVTYTFPPQLTPNAIQIARALSALVQRGHAVTVVAVRPEQADYPIDQDLNGLVETSIRVQRTGSVEGRTLGRLLMAAGAPDPKVCWGPGALQAVRRLSSEEDFDAIFTFAQPFTTHVIGLRLYRTVGLPWVAYFSDPWAGNPYHRVYGPLHRTVQRALERRVVRAADKIVVVSATHAGQLAKMHGAEVQDRIALLPHAYDPQAYPPTRSRDAGAFVVTHVGYFYGPRTPDSLLQAAARLNPSNFLRLRLRFVGGWPPALPRRIRELGLADRVELIGSVGYAESLGWIVAADLLVVFDAPVRGVSPFLPSKLIEYLGSGRPILGITPPASETARVLHRLGLPVRNPDDIEGIRHLLASYLDGFLPPAAPPPPEFAIDTVVKGWEEVVLSLHPSRGKHP